MGEPVVAVPLPPGWKEVGGGEGPRAFARDGKGGGQLRIAIYPPDPALEGDRKAAEAYLGRLIAEGAEAGGEVLLAGCDPCAAGSVAYSLRMLPGRGLVQFWLVPAGVLILAVYTMGSAETVEEELVEANRIVRGITIRRTGSEG